MDVIKILSKLISFDTSSIIGIIKIIEYLQSFLRNKDINFILLNDEAIIIEPKYLNKSNVDLLFSGHIDVVPAEDKWNTDPFKLFIDNNKLYGRGTTDMKGFIACLLHKIDFFISNKVNFIFCFSTDEETSCQTIYKICNYINNNYEKINLAIVGEPTKNIIYAKHKGCTDVSIDIYGKSVHSSNPKLGINAINLAINQILELNKILNKYNIDNNITSNIGKINGGIATNIVPDYCNFCFDIRSYDYNCVQNILNDFKNSFINNKIKFNLETTCNILPLNNTNNKFNSKSLNFSTEAGFFQNLCNISTIVCGCGDIKQAHQVNEFIETEQIEEYCKLLEKIILNKFIN